MRLHVFAVELIEWREVAALDLQELDDRSLLFNDFAHPLNMTQAPACEMLAYAPGEIEATERRHYERWPLPVWV